MHFWWICGGEVSSTSSYSAILITLVFTFVNVWKKLSKNNILSHEEITQNSNSDFRVYRSSFTGTQPHCSVFVLVMATFIPQRQSWVLTGQTVDGGTCRLILLLWRTEITVALLWPDRTPTAMCIVTPRHFIAFYIPITS